MYIKDEDEPHVIFRKHLSLKGNSWTNAIIKQIGKPAFPLEATLKKEIDKGEEPSTST
jgi:hypothetical protein